MILRSLWLCLLFLAWPLLASGASVDGPQGAFLEALELQKAGKSKEALVIYERLLEKDPANPVLLNNLGLTAQQLGEEEKAESYYRKAIKFEPNDAHAYNNLGSIFRKNGDLIAAKKLFGMAIEKDPTYPFSYNNLASLYKDQKLYDDAILTYEKAIEIISLPEFHYNLGVLLFELKRYPRMVTEFKQALELKPDYPEAIFSLCLAYIYNLDDPKRSQAAKRLLLETQLKKIKELAPEMATELEELYIDQKIGKKKGGFSLPLK